MLILAVFANTHQKFAAFIQTIKFFRQTKNWIKLAGGLGRFLIEITNSLYFAIFMFLWFQLKLFWRHTYFVFGNIWHPVLSKLYTSIQLFTTLCPLTCIFLVSFLAAKTKGSIYLSLFSATMQNVTDKILASITIIQMSLFYESSFMSRNPMYFIWYIPNKYFIVFYDIYNKIIK